MTNGDEIVINEFEMKSDKSKYMKNFLQVYAVALLLAVYGAYRIWNSNINLKEEITYAIVIGFPLVLIISALRNYLTDKEIKYIFLENSIKILRKNRTEYYKLNDLNIINRPSEKDIERYGIDYIILNFADNKKIQFSNTLPEYNNLKSFLKKYLYDRVDYSKVLNGAEF